MTRIANGRRRFVWVLVVSGSLLLVVCTIYACGSSRIRQQSIRATAEAEAFLTELYGAEVSQVIENLESQRYEHIDRDQVLYATSVSVQMVRVLEYSPHRFKAIADVTREMAVARSTGEFLRSEDSIRMCGIYVFVREDDTWKLAGDFNISPYLDVGYGWDYAPAWLKEVIGELPDDHNPCDWTDRDP